MTLKTLHLIGILDEAFFRGMLIASRQIFWKDRKLSALDYVQDGLLSMWDGIENAGFGIHLNETGNWHDLIGNNSFEILSNNYGNFLDNCYITKPPQDNSSPIGKIGKVLQFEHAEVVSRPLFNQPIGQNIFTVWNQTKSGSTAITNDIIYTSFNADKSIIGFSKNSTGKFSGCRIPITENTIYSISVNYNLSDYSATTAYINGHEYPVVEAPEGGNHNAGGRFTIGGREQGYSSFHGCIYCIRLYSKSLSVSDIQHNYQVDKKRFNII